MLAEGMKKVLVCLSLAAAPLLAAPPYRVGVAAVDITPGEPIYMSGYANRTHASEGVVSRLKAKCLVIEDRKGVQAAIVTTDLIGLPRSISDPVAARVQKAYGIQRANLLLNSSHTHTGPLVGDNLHVMFDLSPQDQAAVDRYAGKLSEDLVAVVGSAIQNLAPAELRFGHGQAHFAINRRQGTPNGVKIGLNPEGPTDPDVPVLKVSDPDGRLRAVLFGYSCHNTTLTGDYYKITGDYAGFAQADIEKSNPGATAMFIQLCAGDQNPNPRTTLEDAQRHGADLAAAVLGVANSKLPAVRGAIRSAFQVVDLEFAYRTRDQFAAEAQSKNPWQARRARAMLRDFDEGHPIRHYPYPVQAISFGKDFTVLALGGEVVVDYCLRVKREYGNQVLAAGYSNDVMAYIPTRQILKEGGYEPVDSMIYYGQPGPWADDVEDRIFTTIRQVMGRAGRKAR